MMLDGEKLLNWFKGKSPGLSLKDCVVDAVPVVRCKDCRWAYYEFDDVHCCALHKGLLMISPDSFCSYGQKRNAEEE